MGIEENVFYLLERETKRETEVSHASTGSLGTGLQWPGLGQALARPKLLSPRAHLGRKLE